MTKLHSKLAIFSMVLLSSCSALNKSVKYQFADEFYTTKLSDSSTGQVYILNVEDTLKVFETIIYDKKVEVDTLKKPEIFLKEQKNLYSSLIFKKSSLDIDFLTILLKYRPVTPTLPNQLNTNLNGAVYLGFRNDYYSTRYKKNPFSYSRFTTHYGLSFGGFAGLGSTTMSPSVTDNLLQNEYDGVVFTKGIAAIIGINNATIGFTFGFDNLLDANRNLWIYDGKPWVGLAFGLNLN